MAGVIQIDSLCGLIRGNIKDKGLSLSQVVAGVEQFGLSYQGALGLVRMYAQGYLLGSQGKVFDSNVQERLNRLSKILYFLGVPDYHPAIEDIRERVALLRERDDTLNFDYPPTNGAKNAGIDGFYSYDLDAQQQS